MSTEAITNTSEPKWQRTLGLKADDVVTQKLVAISQRFKDLGTPPLLISPESQKALFPEPLKVSDSYPAKSENFPQTVEPPEFRYGPDYFFGKNAGNPDSILKNAQTAIFEDEQGVEMWRILKSVAFSTPDKRVVVAHTRGDRQVNKAELASIIGVKEDDLILTDDLTPLGVKYGTVNPFAAAEGVYHVFDRDLIAGKEYPGDDRVFTSSGDTGYYVGFNIRRYLEAISSMYGNWQTYDIGTHDPKVPERVVARRPVTIIGGDSAGDTANSKKQIAEAITNKLREHRAYENHSAYFGDRSIPDIDAKSDRALASSIDIDLYGDALRAHVAELGNELQTDAAKSTFRPIVAFSSMAMDAVGGPVLRKIKDIEYVGPKEGVEARLSELDKQGVGITHTILLGLPSVYDKDVSAFTGDVLNKALRLDDNAKTKIQNFIKQSKTGLGNPKDVFDVLRALLGQAAGGPPDGFRGKNIAVILGASELETSVGGLASFANSDEKFGKLFLVPEEHNKLSPGGSRHQKMFGGPKVTEESPQPKINIIFIRPGEAKASLISQKTLGEA